MAEEYQIICSVCGGLRKSRFEIAERSHWNTGNGYQPVFLQPCDLTCETHEFAVRGQNAGRRGQAGQQAQHKAMRIGTERDGCRVGQI